CDVSPVLHAFPQCVDLLTLRGAPAPPLFPYTTLFRSRPASARAAALRRLGAGLLPAHPRVRELRQRPLRRRRGLRPEVRPLLRRDRKSTRLNSSHVSISYAVFCLKKKRKPHQPPPSRD